MKCVTPGFPDYDLRDYYFDALDEEQSQQVRNHLHRCEQCTAELEQLRLTALALHALPEEEMPRRIAFVSDKVFEPSPLARWFQSFWLSGARLGAVAALFLGVAILVHAFRPAQVIRVVAAPAATTNVDRASVQAAIDSAVAKAVSASEARLEARSDAKLQRVIEEDDRQRRASMSRVAEMLDAMDRQNRVMTVASNRLIDGGQ